MFIGSAGCTGTGASATCGDTRILLYLPKLLSDCKVCEDEEGVIHHLLLFLCNCLDLLDFLLRLKESKEDDLELDEEEDDRCFFLFFDLRLLLDCSLRESLEV